MGLLRLTHPTVCYGLLAGKMADYDIKIVQGDDFAAVIELRQPDGTPADLRGFTARAQMRLVAESTVVVAEFAVSIPLPATQGTVSISLTAAQTALIGAGFYDYGVTLENGGVVDVVAGVAVVMGSTYKMQRRLFKS